MVQKINVTAKLSEWKLESFWKEKNTTKNSKVLTWKKSFQILQDCM